MAYPTPPYVGPTGAAIDFVNQGWTFFESKALLFMNKALMVIDEMGTVPDVAPIEFNITFPDVTGLTAFVAPTRPTLPDLTFNTVDIPDAPSLGLPAAPTYVNAPDYDVQAPALVALPTQPGDFAVPDPGDAPELTTLVLPTSPVIDLPDAPTFLSISLPAAPVINDLQFSGVDPGSAPTLPDLTGVGFTETPYTREVLNDVLVNVRQMLAGNGGLPIAIEFALFQRGRDRMDKLNSKALHEVRDSFASLGYTQPPGAMAARLDEQTQKNQDEVIGLNRDITIQMYTERLTDVRTAVQQGIALEQMLIGQHDNIMARALESAKLLLDTHVAIYNAQVSGFNSAVLRYQADADVFKSRLQAEATKAEIFKSQVDGQRAIADINRAAADAYKSQVDGVVSLIEIYKAQIAGVQAQAQIEATRIEAYRAKVQGFAERVRAYEAQWNGFTAAVTAQQGQFRSFEIGVNAYSSRVNAWAEGERTKSGRYETDIKAANLTLDQYKTRVTAQLGKLQVESARIDALARQTQSLAAMYQADGQIETARSDANTRAFTAAVELATNQTNVQLEEARIKIQNAQQVLLAQIEAIKGTAGALAQLAASAMSAVNFSAGVSGSGSESSGFNYSLSHSQGFQWSGETADNNSPPIY